jgi:hypothetical protein
MFLQSPNIPLQHPHHAPGQQGQRPDGADDRAHAGGRGVTHSQSHTHQPTHTDPTETHRITHNNSMHTRDPLSDHRTNTLYCRLHSRVRGRTWRSSSCTVLTSCNPAPTTDGRCVYHTPLSVPLLSSSVLSLLSLLPSRNCLALAGLQLSPIPFRSPHQQIPT